MLHGQHVLLLPVLPEHVPELRRILAEPEVRVRWRDEAASPGWPFDDPSATRFAVLVDGGVQGLVQFDEQQEVDYRYASIDIFLDPAVHGHGVGRDAVRTLARYLVHDRAHHRLVIDPAADNEAAIRCYAAVGFRPVGIMRRYERDADGDGWHDGLLMDLLADELDSAVQHYVDAIAPGTRPLFDRVHRLVLQAHPEAQVLLSYEMPTYQVGARRLYVGAWQHGVSLYGWEPGRDAGFAARHPELDSGRGTLRLTHRAAAALPDEELRDLVRAALEE